MVLVKPDKKGTGSHIFHQNVGGRRYVLHGKVGSTAGMIVQRPGKLGPSGTNR